MSSFTSLLVVSPLPDGRTWRLMEAFVYEIGELGSGDVIEVAEGFETDFASVPRLLWPIFPPWGRYGKAAILHDHLYAGGGSRRRADELFLEAMTVLKVPKRRRLAMYWAVRLFGYFAWSRKRP